ncbi:MAG: DNA-directed RNA polymerase subunit omega [Thermoguttaceae bacterium]|nr:DNA-directed RNA polymerase subunit omega [Thermoguttaceae bacterium]
MIEELKEETVVRKVGGRFKLSSLIQKRLMMLSGQAPSMVQLNTSDRMRIVIQEILQDKIWLDTEGNLRAREMMGSTTSEANPSGGTPAIPEVDPLADLA